MSAYRRGWIKGYFTRIRSSGITCLLEHTFIGISTISPPLLSHQLWHCFGCLTVANQPLMNLVMKLDDALLSSAEFQFSGQRSVHTLLLYAVRRCIPVCDNGSRLCAQAAWSGIMLTRDPRSTPSLSTPDSLRAQQNSSYVFILTIVRVPPT